MPRGQHIYQQQLQYKGELSFKVQGDSKEKATEVAEFNPI